MNFKIILSSLLVISGFFGYSFVYSNFYKPQTPIVFADIQTKKLYTDSKDLNHTMFVLRSDGDISNIKIASACNVKTEFLESRESFYFFSLEVSQGCHNGEFYLKDEMGIISGSHFSVELIDSTKMFETYTDYPSEMLSKMKKEFALTKDKYKLFASVKPTLTNYEYLKKSRIYDEVAYNYDLVSEILEKRDTSYMIPVVGYQLPTNATKLPNAGRPYRAGYTSGVHEGWDINAPIYTPVVAIDDGEVVYTKTDFDKTDFQNLVLGEHVSEEDKINNLDILRGNQVWIKTMKGDVVFYAHLDKVFSDIKPGMRITRGTPVGTVGISGVPDDNYTDYHLHFEMRKNPLTKSMIGKNTLDDYKKWNWYFKGESKDYVLEHQYDIFQN